MRYSGEGRFSKEKRLPGPPPEEQNGRGGCEGGGFSERSSATSIGAANGRLFRLRKTAMLSRHRRLWLSFPSLALPPEERLAFGLVASTELVPPESRRGFLRVG